jgi:two-component system, response regulator PdtaR
MQDKKKILIVEDEIIVSMEIEFSLQASGFNVVGKAANSGKAIELSKNFTPDIILMDVNIKGEKDGINTSLEILKSYKPIIIFLSAYNDPETRKRMEIIGRHYFLSKPYLQSELKKIILTALSEN